MDPPFLILASKLYRLYFVHGIISVLPDIGRKYYLKTGGWDITMSIFLNGVIESPMLLHVPIGSYIDYRIREKNDSYKRLLILSQMLIILFWGLVCSVPNDSIWMIVFMFLAEVGTSVWIVIIDALSTIVSREEMRSQLEQNHPTVGIFQPTAMKLMSVGNLVGYLSSGYIIKFGDTPTLFKSLMTIVAVCTLFHSCFLRHIPKQSSNSTVSTIPRSGGTNFMNTRIGVIQQFRVFLKNPLLRNFSVFLFFLQTIPSASVAMFYFLTGLLDFTPENMGQLEAFGSGLLFVTLTMYESLLQFSPLRNYLLMCLTFLFVFSMCPIVLVSRTNVDWNLSDFEVSMACVPAITCMIEMCIAPYKMLTTLYVDTNNQASMMALLRTLPYAGKLFGFFLSIGMAHWFNVDHGEFEGMVDLVQWSMVWIILPILVVVVGIPRGQSVGEMMSTMTFKQQQEEGEDEMDAIIGNFELESITS